MSERVPRTIHYCWFSEQPLTPLLRRCVASWQAVMPHYRLRRWGPESFNFDSVPFVRDAMRLKKWAFAADYVRLHALYEEGGIYLDSDVQVFRPFDEFLNYRFFTSHEVHPLNRSPAEMAKTDIDGRSKLSDELIRWIHVQAAVMGAEKQHPFLRACLDSYKDQRLIDADGHTLCEEFIIGPRISKIAEQFGYRYLPTEQHLREGMRLFGPEVFVGNSHFLTPRSYALHLCNGAWHERRGQQKLFHDLHNCFPALGPALNLWQKVARNLAKPFKRSDA